PRHGDAIPLPQELAEYDPLENNFTCIGTTQRNTRCRWDISESDEEAAADRLNIMRSQDPGNSFEQEQLRELADYMLCLNWHRHEKPQGHRIARQWYKQLEPARAALEARRNVVATPQKPRKIDFNFGSPTGFTSSSTTNPF